MKYQVKITEYQKQEIVGIQYLPNPSESIYTLYEEGVKEMLIKKLLTLLNDENAEIQVVKEERYK